MGSVRDTDMFPSTQNEIGDAARMPTEKQTNKKKNTSTLPSYLSLHLLLQFWTDAQSCLNRSCPILEGKCGTSIGIYM